MKYEPRERFTFAQIADKMEDLNVKAQGTNQESVIQLSPQIYEESGVWNIRPSDLTLGKQVARGSFGEVFECFLSTNNEMKLAIKFLKGNNNRDQRDEFDKETNFMKSLAHQYVVQLYG